MMRHLDMPPRGKEKVRNWVGNGVERLVQRALIDRLDGEPDAALYEKAYPVFLKLYTENTSKRSHLYPGVQEGLHYLKGAGFPLGCVTNKAAQFTEPLLRDLGIADYFSVTISGDTLPRKKPDPAPLLYAAEFFQVPPQASLMIGDSVSDVKAARAAGFQIVCMSYGYNHGEDIRASYPDAVIDSLVEIRGLLEKAT
jgi:phosphoglycolate phosphatase